MGTWYEENLRAREEPALRGLKDISCHWKQLGVMTNETCKQAQDHTRVSQDEDLRNDPRAMGTIG